MHFQHCVKGIGANISGDRAFGWNEAREIIDRKHGISCNRLIRDSQIHLNEIPRMLTEENLDRHLHAYDAYKNNTPFISLASGAVGRSVTWRKNFVYSAIDTALTFATRNWAHPGALFYLWVVVGNDRAVPIASLAEPVRDLNIYQRWSRFQNQGEVTAKIHIPANQIEKVEWWDAMHSKHEPKSTLRNAAYVDPTSLSIRELF